VISVSRYKMTNYVNATANNNSTVYLDATAVDATDAADFLMCGQERLDQNSPELWPEQIPGVTEFTSKSFYAEQGDKKSAIEESLLSCFNNQEINQADKETIRELGTLTVTQIMDKFQTLRNQSYQLGLQEAKEMTRGKFLNVLGSGKVKKEE